jgi:hypothetical protein
LIQLFPDLELSIQYDFGKEFHFFSSYIYFNCLFFLATSITYENLEPRVYLFHGNFAHWKTLHSVPHDLGDPGKFIEYILLKIYF